MSQVCLLAVQGVRLIPIRMPQTDRSLPQGWDLSLDIIMVMGEGSAAIGKQYADLGVQRVLAVCPAPLTPEPVLTGVTPIRSEMELATWLRKLPKPAKNVRVVRSPGCSLPAEITDRFTLVMQQVAQRQRDFLKPLFDLSPLWAANGLRNYAHVAANPMLGDLKNAFAGVPLIVVGAGPSLAKNIDVLRRAQGKAVIVAVNRTLRSLQNAGIHPDLTIALEPRDVVSQFEGIDLSKIACILLATTVDRNLYEIDAQQFISYYSQLSIDGWMFDEVDHHHEAASLGTVSHSAFSLGIQWGFDPIIMVGHDLSFPGGNYYHKDGADGDTKAVYDEAAKKWKLQGYSDAVAHTLKGDDGQHFDGVQVPGYYGGTVPTSASFAQYRAWFENQALVWKDDRALLNCTEGGAHIAGMDHRPLAEVVDALPQRSFDLAAALSDPALQSGVHARRQRMRARLQRMHRDLGEVVRLSRDALQLIDKASHRPKLLGRLQQTEGALKAKAREVPVLNLAIQETIKETIAAGGEIKTVQDSLRMSRSLYTILNRSAFKLHKEASEVLDSWPS